MRKWLLFCQGQHQARLIRMALGVIHMIATLKLWRVNWLAPRLVVTLNPFESIWNDLFVDTLIAFLRLSSLASSLGNLSTSFRKAPTLRFLAKFSYSQLNREVHHVSKHLKLVHICLLAILVMVDTGTFRVTLPASLLRLSQVDHQQGHHHPAHRHKCWDGEQHIFRSQLHRECSSSVNFGAESQLVMAIVLFTTARLNLQFTSCSPTFDVDRIGTYPVDALLSTIESWNSNLGVFVAKLVKLALTNSSKSLRWLQFPVVGCPTTSDSCRRDYLDMLNLSSPSFHQKRPSIPTCDLSSE